MVCAKIKNDIHVYFMNGLWTLYYALGGNFARILFFFKKLDFCWRSFISKINICNLHKNMNYLLDLYICHKMYSNSGPICRKLAMTVPRSSGRNSGNVGCKWTYYMVGKRTNENSSGRVRYVLTKHNTQAKLNLRISISCISSKRHEIGD